MNRLSKLSLCLLSALTLLVPSYAQALSIPLPEGSTVSGTMTKSALFNPSGGLVSTGLGSVLPYTITWTVENLPDNYYRYTYDFTNLAGLSPFQNDFFIEADSLSSVSVRNIVVKSGLVGLNLGSDYTYSQVSFNNPGISTEKGHFFQNTGLSGLLIDHISFETNAAPVWGDFAQGDITISPFVFGNPNSGLLSGDRIYNVGWGTNPPFIVGTDTTNWIAAVGVLNPEPATLLTLATTLTASYFISRRKLRDKPKEV